MNYFSFILFLVLVVIEIKNSVCSFHLVNNDEWSLAEGEQNFHDWISESNNNLRRTERDSSNDEGEYDMRTGCLEPKSNQPDNRVDTSIRLRALREDLFAHSFNAIIIPSSDEHQNEFVAPSDKRREFITGFTGSSGTAVVTIADNALWTDSRYTLQADQQVDCSWKVITTSQRKVTPPKWLTKQLSAGSKVGGDIRLFGAKEWIEARNALNESKIILEDIGDLFDNLWQDMGRPSKGNGTIFVHDIIFAGISWETKVKEIRAIMKEEGADLLVVSALDEVAWLLNLRGNDIPYNAVFRSYVIIESGFDKPIHLFLENPSELPEKVKKHLKVHCPPDSMCVNIHNYKIVKTFLEEISAKEDIKKVLLSDAHAYSPGVSYYIYSAVPESKRVLEVSPIMLRKARKEEREALSMREAQTKDSVALVEFFSFLEKEIKNGVQYDEISVLKKLRWYRSQQPHFRGDSFEAISAFGSNGALAHYIPTPKTAKKITKKSLYLLDSGGQYLDGTTDVTRTLHFGTPTLFQIEAYTRVLQGVIDLATLVFPWGMRDIFVDIIARRPLYDSGLDYGHGTGHGIGLYLNVHEGPTLLTMNEGDSSQIEEGQFFSDEPGYYKKNDFGIRLESILRVVNHTEYKDRNGHLMLMFEVTTLVPFEPKLIDFSLLTLQQCEFLNEYNSRIRRIIGRRLLMKGNQEAHMWMSGKTKPIKCASAFIVASMTTISFAIICSFYFISDSPYLTL